MSELLVDLVVLERKERERRVLTRWAEVRGENGVACAVRMGEGAAIGAVDTFGRMGWGAAVEGKASRAERGRVETEDTGSAEAAEDA